MKIKLPIKVKNPEDDNEWLVVDRNAHDEIEIRYGYDGSSDWTIPMSDELWAKFVKAIREPEDKCINDLSIDCKDYVEGYCVTYPERSCKINEEEKHGKK